MKFPQDVFQLNVPHSDAALQHHINWVSENILSYDYEGKKVTDGVARLYHGTLHATRVALWVPLVVNLTRLCYLKLNSLSQGEPKGLQTDGEIEIKLAQLAALFHDTGRENDNAEDNTDEDSAYHARHYLRNSKIHPIYEGIVVEAIEKKEAVPNLESNDLLTTVINALHDADCLDVVRTRYIFTISYLTVFKKFVPEFEKHGLRDQFILLLQKIVNNVRRFSASQGDSLYAHDVRKKHDFERDPRIYERCLTMLERYPILQSLIYANELSVSLFDRLLEQRDIRIEVPHQGELCDLNEKIWSSEVFVRGVSQAALFSEKDHFETMADVEVRKFCRRPDEVSKKGRLNKHGNGNRSISCIGYGTTVFSPVGFVILNPDPSRVITVNEHTLFSGFGKKPRYFSNNKKINASEELKMLHTKLMEGTIKRYDNFHPYTEITFNLRKEDVSAIYICMDMTTGAKYLCGSMKYVSMEAYILEAIHLRFAYQEKTGIKLPILVYSYVENRFLHIFPIEFFDILGYWKGAVSKALEFDAESNIQDCADFDTNKLFRPDTKEKIKSLDLLKYYPDELGEKVKEIRRELLASHTLKKLRENKKVSSIFTYFVTRREPIDWRSISQYLKYFGRLTASEIRFLEDILVNIVANANTSLTAFLLENKENVKDFVRLINVLRVKDKVSSIFSKIQHFINDGSIDDLRESGVMQYVFAFIESRLADYDLALFSKKLVQAIEEKRITLFELLQLLPSRELINQFKLSCDVIKVVALPITRNDEVLSLVNSQSFSLLSNMNVLAVEKLAAYTGAENFFFTAIRSWLIRWPALSTKLPDFIFQLFSFTLSDEQRVEISSILNYYSVLGILLKDKSVSQVSCIAEYLDKLSRMVKLCGLDLNNDQIEFCQREILYLFRFNPQTLMKSSLHVIEVLNRVLKKHPELFSRIFDHEEIKSCVQNFITTARGTDELAGIKDTPVYKLVYKCDDDELSMMQVSWVPSLS